jgi:hypothetical protein
MVQGGNEVGKEESDLKRSHEGFKMSALDRTNVRSIALKQNHAQCVIRASAQRVCVMWASVLEHT